MQEKPNTYWWEHIKESWFEKELRLGISSFRKWWFGVGRFKPTDWFDKLLRFLEKFCFVFLPIGVTMHMIFTGR